MTKPTENAFPLVLPVADDFSLEYGLSKREYFAALALQGIIANRGNEVPFVNPEIDPSFPELALVWAQDAVAAADALLEVLNWRQHADSND